MAEFVKACQVDQRLALGAHHPAVVPLRARASQRFDPLSGPYFEAAALFSALVPPPALPHRRCIRTYAAQHFWDGLPRFARRMMREDPEHVFCAGGKGLECVPGDGAPAAGDVDLFVKATGPYARTMVNAAAYRFFSIAQDIGLQVEHTLHTPSVRTQGSTVQLIRLQADSMKVRRSAQASSGSDAACKDVCSGP